jgi:hypothetical protein
MRQRNKHSESVLEGVVSPESVLADDCEQRCLEACHQQVLLLIAGLFLGVVDGVHTRVAAARPEVLQDLGSEGELDGATQRELGSEV